MLKGTHLSLFNIPERITERLTDSLRNVRKITGVTLDRVAASFRKYARVVQQVTPIQLNRPMEETSGNKLYRELCHPHTAKADTVLCARDRTVSMQLKAKSDRGRLLKLLVSHRPHHRHQWRRPSALIFD